MIRYIFAQCWANYNSEKKFWPYTWYRNMHWHDENIAKSTNFSVKN